MNRLPLLTLGSALILSSLSMRASDADIEEHVEDHRGQMSLVTDTLESRSKNEHDINPETAIYTTLDGNERYYHTPHPHNHKLTPELLAYMNSAQYTKDCPGDMFCGGRRVDYSLGVIKSPYTNLEEMELNTKVPESLGEIDFFVNYINAKMSTRIVLVDPRTGNRYHNYFEQDSTIQGVEFEGEKHWNIQRFLIAPHYSFFNRLYKAKITKTEARINALYDMYKYFLFLEEGNRDIAWKKANTFMEENVDPLVNSKWEEWMHSSLSRIPFYDYASDPNYYVSDETLYSSNDNTSMPEHVLRYNREIYSGKKEGIPFNREEVLEALIDYNIVFRRKSKEEAIRIATESVDAPIERYKAEVEELKSRPITEEVVIKEYDFPEGWEGWSSGDKQDWLWDPNNKDELGEIIPGFSEEDRVRLLKFYSGFIYAPSDSTEVK